jgi:hypothetical protein
MISMNCMQSCAAVSWLAGELVGGVEWLLMPAPACVQPDPEGSLTANSPAALLLCCFNQLLQACRSSPPCSAGTCECMASTELSDVCKEVAAMFMLCASGKLSALQGVCSTRPHHEVPSQQPHRLAHCQIHAVQACDSTFMLHRSSFVLWLRYSHVLESAWQCRTPAMRQSKA